jgi:hypothetical protein
LNVRSIFSEQNRLLGITLSPTAFFLGLPLARRVHHSCHRRI